MRAPRLQQLPSIVHRLPPVGRIYAAVIPFLILSLPAAATGATVESRITRATVFPDRALVTRSASLNLGAGEHTLVFAGLPASLLDASAQIDGKSTADLMVLDVNVRTAFVDITPDARIRTLEEQRSKLLGEMRNLDDRKAVLDARKDTIDRIVLASTHRPNDAPGSPGSPQDWNRLLSFVDEGLTEIARARREIAAEMERIQAKIEAVENQLRPLRTGGRKAVKEAVVRVTLDQPGTADFELSYQSRDARWTPAYDARLSGSDRRVSLSYFGVVRQASGEDWSNVDLTLSTARPSLGGAAPEVYPWYVDERRDIAFPPPMPAASMGRVAEFLDAATPAQPGEPKVDFRRQEARVSTQLTSVSFSVPAPATIPGDNTPHRVGIGSAALQARLEYETAPKFLSAAFLQAKVTNTSEMPFLAGPMNVFLDGRFVATSSLDTVFPRENFDLALGPDEAIRVERKLVNRFTEDLGLISKRKRVTYDILITLDNTKQTIERIHLRDHLPVSRNENIVVKLLNPPERDLKPDPDGRFTWTIDLKGAEKREIPLRFSVEYPVDMEIAGLD